MAMPPTPAASPAPAAAGADPMMAGGAPPDDMGAADDAQPPVLFTVLGSPGGPFTLVPGDEDEGADAGAPAAGGAPMAAGGDESAPEGQSFDTPQALMQAIMALLNPSKGADDAFASGFKGDKGGPPGM